MHLKPEVRLLLPQQQIQLKMINLKIKDTIKSAVLLIIFNKPDKTFEVINEIRKVRPRKLYISSDGPREMIPNEFNRVMQSREITNQIDWTCDVYNNFSNVNSGSAKAGVSNGINWFFSCETEGIILESDCLPTKSFFFFCDFLLEYYRNDTRIMHISGNNFQHEKINKEKSYYFSKIPFIWGWATWARAWKYYDVDLKSLIKLMHNNNLCDEFENKKMNKYWTKKFYEVYNKSIDTWDYQWLFSILSQNGLCITPNFNLVTNIGFDENALNTKISNNYYSKYKAQNMDKLFINDFVIRDKEADFSNFKNVFNPNLLKKLYIKILEYKRLLILNL